MSLTSTAVSTIQAPGGVDRVAVSVVAVPASTATDAVAGALQPPAIAATDVAAQPAQLARAVDDLNQRFKDSRTDLRFSIDDDSGVTVVSIVDADDGTVLRQMPTEEALRVAKALDQALDQKLGRLIRRVA